VRRLAGPTDGRKTRDEEILPRKPATNQVDPTQTECASLCKLKERTNTARPDGPHKEVFIRGA